MNRLTRRRAFDGAVCPNVPSGTSSEYIVREFTADVYDRLAEYEDIGLSPEEIRKMLKIGGDRR